MVQGLSFVLMHVRDVAAVRGFYTEKLGFTVDAEQPGFVQFARRSGDDATYALGQTPPNTPEGPELWWYVDDADASHAELAARGVEIVSPPADQPFGRTFAVRDPAGNTLNMLQLRQ